MLKAVYSYEDGSLETFRRAHELGIKCIYDLPIGYWRAFREISQEESELEPEWAPTLDCFRDSDAKLARKDEELSLADVIFVMSSFTKDTLKLAKGISAPIRTIPLGTPPIFDKTFEPQPGFHKTKVIYVGSLTQRKGLSYLLKAISAIGKKCVELTLVGVKPHVKCRPLEDALNAYRWIPSLSHAEILKIMRSHDVLVLPSLFEGFGLVILEAMSQGLPVITTPNTCGPDIITDGVDGFIVPIRSAVSIAEKIEALHNHDLLINMSRQAIKKAALYGWDRYRRSIVCEISSI
jgi:glycosyltransferase involved in cell wall biosynthesis